MSLGFDAISEVPISGEAARLAALGTLTAASSVMLAGAATAPGAESLSGTASALFDGAVTAAGAESLSAAASALFDGAVTAAGAESLSAAASALVDGSIVTDGSEILAAAAGALFNAIVTRPSPERGGRKPALTGPLYFDPSLVTTTPKEDKRPVRVAIYASDLPELTRARVEILLDRLEHEGIDVSRAETKLAAPSSARDLHESDLEALLRRATTEITLRDADESLPAVVTARGENFLVIDVTRRTIALQVPPDPAFLDEALAELRAARAEALHAVEERHHALTEATESESDMRGVGLFLSGFLLAAALVHEPKKTAKKKRRKR